MSPSIKGRAVAFRALIGAASLLLVATSVSAESFGQPGHQLGFVRTGPSSSDTPYIIPHARGVDVKSLLTVGDSVDGYRMVGIPDGLGVYRSPNDTFTVLMNHELNTTEGGPHAHAPSGAFISKWRIRRSDHTVISGGDLIEAVATYDPLVGDYDSAAYGVLLGRLCSADLPRRSAFYHRESGLGFDGRIFLNGEEVGSEGRAFGTVVSGAGEGIAYELPYLGKFSWENAVAHPDTGDRTIVIGLDDTTPGQVYVYTGDKSSSGNPIEQAGLAGGSLFGIKIGGLALEDRAAGIGGPSQPFSLAAIGDASQMTGAELETASDAAGVTEFLRPEDGAWDPSDPNDFYFVTTDRFNSVKRAGEGATVNTPAAQEGASRLWRLSFIDSAQPELGGTMTELLDGSTGQDRHQMFDNMTIDREGRVLLQEDPGGQPALARVWRYDIASDELRLMARFDRNRFGNDSGEIPVAPFTNDEESSGIIDAGRAVGQGWFLLDVQAHYPDPDPTLVQGGQLMLMRIP